MVHVLLELLSLLSRSQKKWWTCWLSVTNDEQQKQLWQTLSQVDLMLFAKSCWFRKIGLKTLKRNNYRASYRLLIWLVVSEGLLLRIGVLDCVKAQKSTQVYWLSPTASTLWVIRTREGFLFRSVTVSWLECSKTHWAATAKQLWSLRYHLPVNSTKKR